MANGCKVNWARVWNVTALFQLPEINVTDGTIYLVLSLMTKNGSIIQAAAGLYPNSTRWGTYAMFIGNPEAINQTYTPVISTEEPHMEPGDQISISIYYMPSNGWCLNLKDSSSGRSITAYFNKGLPPSLKVGDQFVFALESYTTNLSVFRNMENITLSGIFIDGERVVSGGYLYTGWNNQYNPLFIVGDSNVPTFISVSQSQDGNIVWTYEPEWAISNSTSNGSLFEIFLILAITAIVNGLILILLVVSRIKSHRKGF